MEPDPRYPTCTILMAGHLLETTRPTGCEPRADARAREVELAGIGFGVGDQFRRRSSTGRSLGHDPARFTASTSMATGVKSLSGS